jgi:hypothetical protein
VVRLSLPTMFVSSSIASRGIDAVWVIIFFHVVRASNPSKIVPGF